VGFAGAACLGSALHHAGVHPPAPLALLLALALPILLWRRPTDRSTAPGFSPTRRLQRTVLLAALVGGWMHTAGWARADDRDCRWGLAEGGRWTVQGLVVGRWRSGPVVRVREGLPTGCRVELRVRSPGSSRADRPSVTPGAAVRVTGRWRPWGISTDPAYAGELVAESVTVDRERAGAGTGGAHWIRWREGVRTRLTALFPERAALVAALVLARKEGVDRELRDGFTRSGVAHLLAISGFHVGVIAMAVLVLLRATGLSRERAAGGCAAAVWAYVVFIGAPDAAVRAAILTMVVAAGVARGRPVHRVGALASALLLFLLVDPGAVGRPGFQLSFAGAAGLALLAAPVDRGLARRLRWRTARALRGGVAAGVAATVATLPAVGWHFGELSTVGIPVTLAATPLVAAAIPGILASLVLDLLPGPLATFTAGGTDLVLAALVEVVEASAELSFAVVPVARRWILAGVGGAVVAVVWITPSRTATDLRLALGAAGCVAGLLLLPVGGRLAVGSSMEIAVFDVGQGDAIGIRSPAGRWILVDAGPGAPGGGAASASEAAAVRALRDRGVTRLEALLLSHPDLDHIGGVVPLVESFDPALVAGPGHVRGTEAYRSALEAAAAADGGDGIRWLALARGQRLRLDGVHLEVLHPAGRPDASDEPNASSLVLLLRFGAFTALLTGDAPRAVEEDVAGLVGDVDLLKVAHHGSRTSSSPRFLAAVTPEVALVSVGRRNRYGHPHPEVTARLEAAARLLRTDRNGTIRVTVERDGGWRVRTERGSEGQDGP